MPVCTFFGHRDSSASIEPKLKEVLVDLIENHDVDIFYVGNQGRFDFIVRNTLRDLSKKYSHIYYAVVLAYMPDAKDTLEYDDFYDTILPEGIEFVSKRFAISWRNKWMLKRADFVVTHVIHSFGGAAEFSKMAKKQGKTVFNIE